MATEAQEPKVRTSRIGKRPIPLPKGVTVSLEGQHAQVKGPKGSLTWSLPVETAVKQEGDLLRVTSSAPGRAGPRLQGLVRAQLANMVHGVTAGYQRILELHGTGYRAELQGRSLHLALGFSHPVVFPLPEGVTASVPADSKGTVIEIGGLDKAVVGQTAATLRSFRPPEPYAGKGVRYRGERVREKAGKAGK
jgi:large subunit ribosomal protein L6